MAAALVVAACSYLPDLGPATSASAGIDPDIVITENPGIPMPQPVPVAAAPSPRSNELRLYYTQIAQSQQTANLLQDGLSAGASVDPQTLARVFKALAFRDEFSAAPRPLQRWENSLGAVLMFGPSVDEGSRNRIKGQVTSVLRTVTDLTGLPTGTHPWLGDQLIVYVMNDGERLALAPTPPGINAPGPNPIDIQLIRNMRRTDQCMVITYHRNDVRGFGIVIIREELPPVLQLACIQEEITQALGLTHDSPDADPSIFNDNDEYATLTGLDRALLKLLYHPRLKPGMTLQTAAPIIDEITAAAAPQVGG